MRVYIPSTTELLHSLGGSGELASVPITAFAVTPGLREWYVDDDLEELEYAAMLEAARASLRLIQADPRSARLRVVIAAEVPDHTVEIRDDLDRAVVRITGKISIGDVASVHVDSLDASAVVAEAASKIDAADLGDRAAQDVVDDAEGFELCWYATQEIEPLLATVVGPQPP